ncbi:hypothetical protein SDB65_12835, partial [Legionella pneumophila serogroup 1]
VFGLLANLGQAEVRGCFKTEQNWLATCQNCSINGFKLRTRPSITHLFLSKLIEQDEMKRSIVNLN